MEKINGYKDKGRNFTYYIHKYPFYFFRPSLMFLLFVPYIYQRLTIVSCLVHLSELSCSLR